MTRRIGQEPSGADPRPETQDAAKLGGTARVWPAGMLASHWVSGDALRLAIAGAAIAIIASIWAVTLTSIQTSERAARADAAADVSEVAHRLKLLLEGGAAGASAALAEPSALVALLERFRPGPGGLVELFGPDGGVRAVASPLGSALSGDVSTSEMVRWLGSRGRGVWTGRSAPDGVRRIHAFRRIAGQDLTLVVGVAEDEALGAWAAKECSLAFVVSMMVALIATLLAREASAWQDRQTRLARDHAAIADAYAALTAAKASVDAKTGPLEATLSGMSDGVMMLDENECLVQWNERFAELAGLPAGVLRVGVPLEELIRAQVRSGGFGSVDVDSEVGRRMAELRAQLSAGVSERQRPGGPPLELRRTALPSGGFVTLYTDVTARKQIEAAQQAVRRAAEDAAEQKSRFVATVSHEIRTPLGVLVSCLTLLDDESMSPLQRRHCKAAREAGYALLDLVNDILELSSLEAGRPEIRPVALALRPVLEGVQDMFRRQAEARGMTLVVEIAADVPDRICADAVRIRQVVINFVSNATKFAEPGRLTIGSSVVRGVQGRPELRLSVQDPGPAVPEHEARQLFQPFSRLENARTGGVPGTGLGLAICARLALLMDGAVGVGVAPTGGNDFWMTLPLKSVETTPGAENQATLRQLRRAAVLIVEDVPANEVLTAALLRREGHRVDVARSGVDAIALVRRCHYDLVLMDLIMPGMNGDEATRRMRALDGGGALVPIVALTASTSVADRARCRAAGMNDTIAKPARLSELREVVAGLLRPLNARQADGPTPSDASAPTMPAPLPLDLNRMAELRRGLPDGAFSSLLEQCLVDMETRIRVLRGALAAGQTNAVEDCAHALKGVAATYGLAALESSLLRVVSAARASDYAGATVAADDVERELARASAAVSLELRDHIA